MKAMILAAGRGERMHPLTDHTPKPLLEVGQKPLIAWHLCRLHKAGIRDVVINHAWLGEQIEKRLGTGSEFGVHIQYSAEGHQGLETAGGIATALPLLQDELFIVINGDVLTNIDFSQFAEKMALIRQNKLLAYLYLVDNPPHNPQGDFVLTADGMVQHEGQGTRLTFSGVGIYHADLFKQLPPNQVAKLAPLLRHAMQENRVQGEHHQGLWLDVGTVERLQQANELCLRGALD